MTEVNGRSVPTPELDRQRELNQPRPPFDVLTQFVDWLDEHGYVVARYGRRGERSERCPRCRGRGFDPDGLSPREQQLLRAGHLSDEQREPCPECKGDGKVWRSYVDESSLEPIEFGWAALFARFWGLDLGKIDGERARLLEELRKDPARCRICRNPVASPELHPTWRGTCGQESCLSAATAREAASDMARAAHAARGAATGDGLKCTATLWHGPGHQSRTRCRVTGEHLVHRASYSNTNTGITRTAEWVGTDVFTDPADEPPPPASDS